MAGLNPPNAGPGAAAPPGACVGCPRTVVTIKAKVFTTQSVRVLAAVPPPKQYHEFSSNSHSKPLAANAPVVLVRNCGPILLEAITVPPNQADVAWAVLPNPGPASAPSVTPATGVHSALTSNSAGGYAISATLDGTTVYWNVVFVDVIVKNPVILLSSKNFKDDSHRALVASSSGDFDIGDFRVCAMWIQAKIVLFAGGDASLNAYCDKVHLGFVQNLWQDTARAHYAGGGKEIERVVVPPRPRSPVVDPAVVLMDLGYPVLDRGADPPSRATGGDTIFLASTVSNPINGLRRTVTTCDSPGVGFSALLPEHGKAATQQATSIDGVNKFWINLTAYSDDANFSYVVFAQAHWTADFSGTIDWTNGPPVWKKTTAKASGIRLQVIEHGKEAQHVKCEVRLPVFLDYIRDAR